MFNLIAVAELVIELTSRFYVGKKYTDYIYV